MLPSGTRRHRGLRSGNRMNLHGFRPSSGQQDSAGPQAVLRARVPQGREQRKPWSGPGDRGAGRLGGDLGPTGLGLALG